MAGSTGAIKAGQAFVELFCNDNMLIRGLDKAAGKFKSWGASMAKMGAGLAGAGGGILAPLVAALKEATSRGNLFGTLAANIGKPVAELSQLASAAERLGVPVEDMAAAMEALEVRAQQAALANDYVFDGIRSLGTGAAFSLLSVAEKMEKVAEAIKGTTDPVRQGMIAQEAYGAVGKSLLPILREGAEGVRKYREETAISAEQAAQSIAVTRTMSDLWKTLKDTVREVGFALLPTAAAMAETKDQIKAAFAAVGDWIKRNRELVVALAAVGAGLVAGGILLGGLGTAFVTVGITIKLALAALSAFGAVLGAVFSPVGLAVVGIGLAGAGIAYLVSQTDQGQESLAYMGESLTALVGRVKEAFAGISDAISAGDWSLAWQIGLAAMKAEWKNFTFYVQLAWSVFQDLFVDGWKDAVAGLAKVFIDFGAFILRNTSGTVRQMIEEFAGVVSIIDEKLGASLRGVAGGLLSDAQINAKRDEMKGGIDSDRAAEQAADTAKRDAENRVAFDERDAARAELAALIEQARKKALYHGLSSYEDFEGEGSGGGGGGPNLRGRLADAVKGITGGSSGAISQQLAFGDSIPQQQLDVARSQLARSDQIATNTADINRALQTSGRVTQ